MDERTTTVRMPGDPAQTPDLVARGRGISVNTLTPEALEAEIERVEADPGLMGALRALTGRDKEILDRPAE